MALILAAIHGILMIGVMALTYEYYGNLPEGYEDIIASIQIPVYFGVFGISVLWAVGHGIFGGIMGMAAGSVVDGIRLALILGTANSIGRLWPYLLTFAIGAFLNHAENWIVIISFLGALACFGIYMFMNFIKNA